EITAVLDHDEADLLMAVYGVTSQGNFEETGATVLNIARPVAEIAAQRGLPVEEIERRVADARMALFAARSRREWPATDDKIITAWNGLMLRAFAEAAAAFDSEAYTEMAVNNAAFILERLRDGDGRLLRTYRADRAHIPAYLEDYACLAAGLLAVYEVTFDRQWFVAARALTDQMIALFADDDEGGFYDTAHDHEQLISRPRELLDNATPAGNSVAAEVLLWLAALTGEHHYRARAERYLLTLAPVMAQQPSAFGHLLCGLDRWLSSSQEIAVVGDLLDPDTMELLTTVRARYRPNTVVACAAPNDEQTINTIGLLADRQQIAGVATAFVCSNFTCQLPVTDPAALAVQLGDA
ncbi:MAG TPA: thioredoxin domain-containing protein, partial [Ktedonobacterales bacterium]|nr:thioredoxin domain-containing protein [Ktedonobacterales bacterium]